MSVIEPVLACLNWSIPRMKMIPDTWPTSSSTPGASCPPAAG